MMHMLMTLPPGLQTSCRTGISSCQIPITKHYWKAGVVANTVFATLDCPLQRRTGACLLKAQRRLGDKSGPTSLEPELM